jgi:hypothetical protein
MNTQSNWRERTEEEARDILGSDIFDRAVAAGEGFCLSRARGYWDANEGEYNGAYICAARMAAKNSLKPA